MRKTKAILNSITKKILTVFKDDNGQPVAEVSLDGLNPDMILVDVDLDDRDNVSLDNKDEIVKGHNWKRLKKDRDSEICQDIIVGDNEYCMDEESFDSMKDRVSIMGDGEETIWKLKNGKRISAPKEQLQAVITEYILRKQDSMEACWEVEDDLSNGSGYDEAQVRFSEKLNTRKEKRKNKGN